MQNIACLYCIILVSFILCTNILRGSQLLKVWFEKVYDRETICGMSHRASVWHGLPHTPVSTGGNYHDGFISNAVGEVGRLRF